MAKTKTIYFCKECGHETPKWVGRCPGCQAWESMAAHEEVTAKGPTRTGLTQGQAEAATALIGGEELRPEKRSFSGIGEFDRCLGAGWVDGSLVLLGGDPGIGKSTLTLQALLGLLKKNPKEKALVISGEESVAQVRARAARLNHGTQADMERLFLVSETCLESMEQILQEVNPRWVIVDSIQTAYSNQVESAAGTVAQVREVALKGMMWAKGAGKSVMLIGHVTKDGAIAGPKLLEHMVDTVLYFEGESHTGLRLLRAMKNRFGPTHEVGVFEMTSRGLNEVADPAHIYKTQRDGKTQEVSGSALCCTMEGTRPFVTEVQALVAPAGYGVGRRTTSGVDQSRASIAAAVVEKYLKLRLGDRDVFVSTVGGVRLADPAADLALAVAVISSAQSRPVPVDTAFLGEVTLTGEVRGVSFLGPRVQELQRLGCTRVFSGPSSDIGTIGTMKIHVIHSIGELQSKLWSGTKTRSEEL